MPKNTHQGPSIAGWNVPLPGETREEHAERLGVDVADLEYTGADADMRRQRAGDRPDTSAPDLGVSGQRESIHSGAEGPNADPTAPAADLRKGTAKASSTDSSASDKGRDESK